jgi:hypothetical protein
MANKLYDKAREKFLDGFLSWSSSDIKIALVNPTYSPDLINDEFADVIGVPNIIAISGNLTGKSSMTGIAGADTVVFLSVAAGNWVSQLVGFKDVGGVLANSPLIFNINTATSFPIYTNGGNITVVWDNINKIFKL